LYNVLDLIEVKIEVTDNPYNLPLDHLFTMAARVNKKRSFLFVSKLLGKHLPINPKKGLITSSLLAARYYEAVKGGSGEMTGQLLAAFNHVEKWTGNESFIPKEIAPLIIGFAETATGLGHAFYDCFEEADYFHTTREVLRDRVPVITFEEEHSHATSHRCYIPLETIDNSREIILVDDELTTGKTALNIIRSIHSQFPRNEYSVVSILDWRSDEDKLEFARLENLLGIKIHVTSLLAGRVEVNQLHDIPKPDNEGPSSPEPWRQTVEIIHLPPHFSRIHLAGMLSDGTIRSVPYIRETGRFGIHSNLKDSIRQKIGKLGSFLAGKRTGKKTLVLGTGEFIYLPMKIAAEMGPGVCYQSTTRSPIFVRNQENYGARYGLAFPNPEDMAVPQFVYNIAPSCYDDLFILFERETEPENLKPLLAELKKCHIKSIKIVYFSNKTGGHV